jgi:putative exosortase-associated protein (TIGR04073 family)
MPAWAAAVPEAAQPLRKLSRGLANGFGGILAIPVTIRQVGEQEGPLAGLTWGVFMGIGVAVTRTLVGIAEVATFPIPLPQVGYGPLLQPEFLFQPET